jgi:hypothetical protein
MVKSGWAFACVECGTVRIVKEVMTPCFVCHSDEAEQITSTEFRNWILSKKTVKSADGVSHRDPSDPSDADTPPQPESESE